MDGSDAAHAVWDGECGKQVAQALIEGGRCESWTLPVDGVEAWQAARDLVVAASETPGVLNDRDGTDALIGALAHLPLPAAFFVQSALSTAEAEGGPPWTDRIAARCGELIGDPAEPEWLRLCAGVLQGREEIAFDLEEVIAQAQAKASGGAAHELA